MLFPLPSQSSSSCRLTTAAAAVVATAAKGQGGEGERPRRRRLCHRLVGRCSRVVNCGAAVPSNVVWWPPWATSKDGTEVCWRLWLGVQVCSGPRVAAAMSYATPTTAAEDGHDGDGGEYGGGCGGSVAGGRLKH